MGKFWLAPFDPTKDFVCRRAFDAAGKRWRNGDDFQKASVPVRTLQQLYEGRAIAVKGTERIIDYSALAARRTRGKPRQDREMVEGDIMNLDPADEIEPIPAPTRDELRAQAKTMGITVMATWGSQRLKDEIAKVANGTA